MKFRKVITLLLLVSLALSSMHTASASDWYTYTYNYWGEPVESPDAYSVTNVLYGKTLGEEVGTFLNPE